MKLLAKRVRKALIGTTLLIPFLYGCNLGDIPNLDNVYLPNYQGKVALLLVRDTLNMGKFLEKNITDSMAYKKGPSQEILFEYRTETDYDLGDNFVVIRGFVNSETVTNPNPTPFTTTETTTLTITEQFEFDYQSGEREAVDSVFYETGTAALNVTSTFPGELQYDFLVSAFKEISTQSSLEFTATLPNPGTQDESSDSTWQALDGYKSILFREDEQNKFIAEVDITITIPAGTPLTGTEDVSFIFYVHEPKTQTIFGFFEQDTIEVTPKAISLGVFNDFSGTGIEFESPVVRLEVANAFGIPLAVDLSGIFARYDDQPDLPFSGPITETPQSIEAPSPQEYLDPLVETSLEINAENSNLRELLASTPKQIVIPLKAYSNLNSTSQNFLNVDSKMDIVAIAQLPLTLRMDGFEYDSDIELGDLDQLNQTENINLLFRTVNELPFTGEVDLYFKDENGNTLDAILGSVLFESPSNYDTNGKATEPAHTETTIALDQDKIDALISATTMTIVTRLNSYNYTNDEFVKVFADYELITTVSVAGTLNIDLNQNN